MTQYDFWEDVPVGVVVEDIDGDRWLKTEDSYRLLYREFLGENFWVGPDYEFCVPPDSIDAPYTVIEDNNK
jgi:hypothetical protein